MAMQKAAMDGDERALRRMLEAGRDPRQVDARGNTPVLTAALDGHVATLDLGPGIKYKV